MIRYYEALQNARDELLAEAEALPSEDKALDEETLATRPPVVQARIMTWRQRDLLRRLTFAPIISGSTNDDPAWRDWTDGEAQKRRIADFKKPLTHADPDKANSLAFLIVKSMLLTGFDAPVAGVMYLDRPIREAELLQAVARVNRTGFGKRYGIVVDYYGVARHLKEALEAYADEDIEGTLASLRNELPVLRDRHLRVVNLFRQRGVELRDEEACIDLLANERLRAEFTVRLQAFLTSLDLILPRPEGLPYTADAKRLAYIHARARNRYKEGPTLGKDVGAKVRKLIDDHVISMGIDPRIPPIQLTDAEFGTHVARQVGERAQASEMEHAIRAHLRRRMDEDPVRYRKLSERLTEILQRLGEQWDEIVRQLQRMVDELRGGEATDETAPADLPEHYVPFLRTILDMAVGDGQPEPEKLLKLKDLTVELVDIMIDELQGNPNIWTPHKSADQEALGGRIFQHLILSRLLPGNGAEALTDALMTQARANHERLLRT